MTNESGEKMGMKEEFEKARFERRISGKEDDALWSALWAVGMCVEVAESCKSHSVELRPDYTQHCYYSDVANEIRQMAKELE